MSLYALRRALEVIYDEGCTFDTLNGDQRALADAVWDALKKARRET